MLLKVQLQCYIGIFKNLIHFESLSSINFDMSVCENAKPLGFSTQILCS